jgi:glycosyltransferase involved in cell wall biosynthesis
VYRGLRVAVVVPAYNEEALVGTVISTMPKLVDEIVVVDDGSLDDTAGAATAVGDARVTVLRNPANSGVGAAILNGYRYVAAGGHDVAVVMAGDAQMDPHYLPSLLDPLVDQGYDFAKGNRFYSRTSFKGMPRHRIVGNVALSLMTRLASGYWHVFDSQNGYSAIRREVLERLPLGRIARGYAFENDLLVHLNVAGARVRDVPIPAVYGRELSNIRLRSVAPALAWLLFRRFWMRLWRKYVARRPAAGLSSRSGAAVSRGSRSRSV